MKIRLPKRKVAQNAIKWTRVDASEWRAGNIRIIQTKLDSCGGSWYVKIKHNGRWFWAYSEQRPWGYGSAGQAKSGVSRWENVFLYDRGPQSEAFRRQQRGQAT